MNLLFPAIFSIQGLAMLIDELYFHRKRGLPRWERIGHPLDTLSVLICYSYLALGSKFGFSPEVYLGLSIFSCVLVTKDEFVHQAVCKGSELWLHALLFVLHPVMLYGAYVCSTDQGLLFYFKLLFVLTALMLLYQIVYWNFFVPESPKDKLNDR